MNFTCAEAAAERGFGADGLRMKRRSANRKSVKRVSAEVRDARRESGETQTRERAGKRGSGVGAGKPGWNVSSRRDDGI